MHIDQHDRGLSAVVEQRGDARGLRPHRVPGGIAVLEGEVADTRLVAAASSKGRAQRRLHGATLLWPEAAMEVRNEAAVGLLGRPRLDHLQHGLGIPGRRAALASLLAPRDSFNGISFERWPSKAKAVDAVRAMSQVGFTVVRCATRWRLCDSRPRLSLIHISEPTRPY